MLSNSFLRSRKNTTLLVLVGCLLVGWMMLRLFLTEDLETLGPAASPGDEPEEVSGIPLGSDTSVIGRTSAGQTQVQLEDAQAEGIEMEPASKQGLEGELTGSLLLRDERVRPSKLIVSCAPRGRTVNVLSSFARNEWSSVTPGESYSLAGLPVGDYRLIVSSRLGGTSLTERLVHVGPGINSIDLHVGDLDIDQSLLLRCLDPKGQPLNATGLELLVIFSEGRKQHGHPGFLPLHNGGQVVDLGADWTQPNGNEETVVRMVLAASHRSFSSTPISLLPGQGEAVLQFSEPSHLTLRFKDVPLDLEGGHIVFLKPSATREIQWPQRIERAGPDGSYQFRRPQLGAAWLNLYLLAGDQKNPYNHNWIQSYPITIRPGNQVLHLPFPPLFEIPIHNPGGWAGRIIQVEKEADPNSNQGVISNKVVMDLNLRGRLENCPAGRYLIRCGSLVRHVEVPCGEVIVQD